MADLREIPPGRPPWVRPPDPWWLWAVRGGLAATVVVYVVGSAVGAVAVGLYGS